MIRNGGKQCWNDRKGHQRWVVSMNQVWISVPFPWYTELALLTAKSSLTIIIMSRERPSKNNPMRKIGGSLQGKLSSLLRLSRAPTQSLIEIDPSSDNNIATSNTGTRWATELPCLNCYLTSSYFEVIYHSIWSLLLATGTHLRQRLLLQNSNHTRWPSQIRYLLQRWYLLWAGNLVAQDQKPCLRSVTMLRSWLSSFLITIHLAHVSEHP